MDTRKIKVLVVEDSPVVQILLVHLFKMDPGLEVVGVANDGEEAIAKAAQLKPDVILMDIQMPKMNGYEATRRIMASDPVPIVICSAPLPEDVSKTFRAIEVGALAFVDKPVGVGCSDFPSVAQNLVQTVKLMSEVKVVKRWPHLTGSFDRHGAAVRGGGQGNIKLVVVGSSTGGPVALQTILQGLPRGFPAPILVVQHIATGFVQGMADWLAGTSGLPVRIATQGLAPLPAHVYLAPDGYHMGVGVDERLVLSAGPVENGLRPAVSHLFRTVAEAHARDVAGILLSGMGKDGAAELKQMRAKGAVTIAQDEETSVVHGMPGEAIAIGAAMHVLSPNGIANLLTMLARQK